MLVATKAYKLTQPIRVNSNWVAHTRGSCRDAANTRGLLVRAVENTVQDGLDCWNSGYKKTWSDEYKVFQ